MVNQDLINSFSKSLTEILNSELDLGNEIDEASEVGKEAIIILLKHPFLKEYKKENVEFREINDPHWWTSEYFDRDTNHILASKFPEF